MSALLENLLIRYARRFPVRRGKLRVIDATWQLAAGARGPFQLARLDVVAINGGVPSVVVLDRAGETLVSLRGDGCGPHPRRMYAAG